MKVKRPDIEVPKHMQMLPISENGYRKPWFVTGEDFRVVDSDKAQIAIAKRACWLCGNPFEETRFALVCSPLSAMTRIFREPPCHVDCAEYAMQVCPFIIYPNSKRRTAGLDEEDTLDHINRGLEVKQSPDNPGEFYLLIVDDFYVDPKDRTLRCDKNNVIETQHWRNGEKVDSYPLPIVPYEELPDEMQAAMNKVEFLNRFGPDSNLNHPQLPNFKRVSYTAFHDKYWLESPDFRFTARDTIVPIGIQELTYAIHHVPVAFIKAGSDFQLVVVLGLLPNRNMLLTPQGTWRVEYIPEVFQCYPFKIAYSDAQGEFLVVNLDSDLVIGEDEVLSSSRERLKEFYVGEDDFSEELAVISSKLSEISKDLMKTSQLTRDLARTGLIKPWPIRIRLEHDGKEKAIEGLFATDESLLNALGSSELAELRNSGALLLAYCQLLSMKHLSKLS